MKNTLILFCIFLLSCSQVKNTIKVQYISSSGEELLSSPVFDDIEIVVLHGDNMPVVGQFANMVVKNETYYISSDKVYLFEITGKYLNSVGERGRGPGEYLYISNVIVEENGDISVYDGQRLYTYSPQGRFLKSTEYHFKSVTLGKANGFHYHFYGNGSGLPCQLYITDSENRVVDSCMASSIVTPLISSPVFSTYQDTLILSPPYGGEIYRLVDGNVEVSYIFDFGINTIPDEFFINASDPGFEFLMTHTVAIKSMFFENQAYAILDAVVFNLTQNWQRILYGLLEKATSRWKWYYMDDTYCKLMYMDESYMYFAAEPTLMKDAGLDESFPILKTLSVDDGVVILKCKLAESESFF